MKSRSTHICLVYAARSLFVTGAVTFLAEGLRDNLRVGYIGRGSRDGLVDELSLLGDVDALLRSGQLFVSSIDEMYPSGSVIDERHQVEVYRDATRQAVCDGYQGLRVAADSTSMVITERQVRAFARYEHLVDHMMLTEPFSGLCGYDTGEVNQAASSLLACLHSVSHGEEPLFHLAWDPNGQLAVTGECDASTTALLGNVLDSIDWAEQRVRIDLRNASFIDHRSLLTIDQFAYEKHCVVELVNVSGPVRKLMGLLQGDISQLVVAA